MPNRVFILGLDCAAPELVFQQWPHLLPNLTSLRQTGAWGRLESTIPPITVPAWMCMMTGRDPGSLGIYGFRNRRDHSYDGLQFASSKLVREPALWDLLGEHGLQTIALGVPLTYPPRPINGLLITDFLAPDTNADYTFPSDLKQEIKEVVGEYIFDTRQFRTDDKERLLADIYTMTEQRFKLATHLMENKPWDLFVMIEMGPDRLHHGFWKYYDPQHPLHQPGNPLQHAIRDYYVRLDAHIGDLISHLKPDDRLIVVSDHGAKRMDGGICFNQWLIKEGYLKLKSEPDQECKLTPDMIDWSQTRAWGDGGYYGRLFINVQGREPLGTVQPHSLEALKREITEKLEQMSGPDGMHLGNKVFRPEDIYTKCSNVPPDLIVYFGDLHWRSVGSVGHNSIYTATNDTGPDDANHAQHGIFIMKDIGSSASDAGERTDLSIYDIAPTVLTSLGVTPPPGVGRTVVGLAGQTAHTDSDAYTPEEEAELARRLEDLGYL